MLKAGRKEVILINRQDFQNDIGVVGKWFRTNFLQPCWCGGLGTERADGLNKAFL